MLDIKIILVIFAIGAAFGHLTADEPDYTTNCYPKRFYNESENPERLA